MTKRARKSHEKEARRQTILNAAWLLLDEKEIQNTSVAEIAAKANLAKGTIYIYFSTKEEIYLTLLDTRFKGWLQEIETALAQPNLAPEDLARAICAYAANRPKFMDLASSSHTVLERNLTYEAAAAYKKGLAESMIAVGGRLEAAFTVLKEGDGVRMLMATYAMILGMWQLGEPSTLVREVLEKESLALFQVNFVEHTPPLLIKLWAGMFPGGF